MAGQMALLIENLQIGGEGERKLLNRANGERVTLPLYGCPGGYSRHLKTKRLR